MSFVKPTTSEASVQQETEKLIHSLIPPKSSYSVRKDGIRHDLDDLASAHELALTGNLITLDNYAPGELYFFAELLPRTEKSRCELRPTAIMGSDTQVLRIFSIKAGVKEYGDDRVSAIAEALGMTDALTSIPLPSHHGFRLIVATDRKYCLDELGFEGLGLLLRLPEGKHIGIGGRHGIGIIKSGDFCLAKLDAGEFSIATGPSESSLSFGGTVCSLLALTNRICFPGDNRFGDYDCAAMALFAEGERKAVAITFLSGIVLHIISDVSGPELDDQISKLVDIFAIRLTRRSSGSFEHQVILPFLYPLDFARLGPSHKDCLDTYARVVAEIGGPLGCTLDQKSYDPSQPIWLPTAKDIGRVEVAFIGSYPWHVDDFFGKHLHSTQLVQDDPQPFTGTLELRQAGKPTPSIAYRPGQRTGSVETIEQNIGALARDPRKEQIEPIVTAISKLDDEYEESRLLESLRKKGPKLAVLTTMVGRAKRAASREADVSLTRDKEGRAIFSFYKDYNDDDLVKAAHATLIAINEPNAANRLKEPVPIMTCMLRTPMKLRIRKGVECFESLSEGEFQAELSNILLMRNTKSGGPRRFVPKEISDICFNTCEDRQAQTPSLLRVPTFDAFFNLISAPGWYRGKDGSGMNIYMAKTDLCVPPVAKKPSAADLKKAVHLIREDLLGEFPFHSVVGDVERREPAEANAIAMLLTLFVRPAINSCTPMFFVSKPVPGTGGTLLGRMPMLLQGTESAPIHVGGSSDELAKAMVAAILESRTVMFFDNMRDFNSPVLLQALTSRKIGGRLLGHSQMIERDNNYLWVGTGNNPKIEEEMDRRICWITLNAKTPDVKGRKFKKNLETWVKKNRGELIWAFLVLVQSWVANDKLPFTARTLPSFEEWAAIVGGILANAGIEGFLDTPKRVACDANDSAARQLVREWYGKWQNLLVSPKELADLALLRDLDAAVGRFPDEKRLKVFDMLNAIEGRTYYVDGKTLIVRRTLNKDGDLVYSLGKVDTGALANG